MEIKKDLHVRRHNMMLHVINFINEIPSSEKWPFENYKYHHCLQLFEIIKFYSPKIQKGWKLSCQLDLHVAELKEIGIFNFEDKKAKKKKMKRDRQDSQV